MKHIHNTHVRNFCFGYNLLMKNILLSDQQKLFNKKCEAVFVFENIIREIIKIEVSMLTIMQTTKYILTHRHDGL